jgi:hypothetical protein
MEVERGVYRWPGLDPLDLGQELRDDGWFVFTLLGEISDKRSFFETISNTLPLDPPLVRMESWDALTDSLRNGLEDEVDSDRIAIIWPDSAKMIRRDPEEFGIAVETLSTTTDTLADSEMTVGHPKQVAIVLT